MYKPDHILSRINDAIWVVDLSTRRFIYINTRFIEIWERPVDILHTSYDEWIDQIHPEDLEYYKIQTDNIETEQITRIEYRIFEEAKTKWVCDNIRFSKSDNSPKGVLTGVLSDITRRKENEQDLKKSEETYRYLFDNNPNPILIFDLETLKFLAINNTALKTYGYSREEFLEITIQELQSPEDHAMITEHIKAEIIDFRDAQYRQHILKNGSALWADMSGHRMIYNGRKAEMIIISNVTEKVEEHAELVRQEKLLSNLINSPTHYVMRLDTKRCYKFINRSFQDKFGYSKEELLGHHFSKITLAEDVQRSEKVFKNCIDHPGRIFPLAHQKVDACGNIFWTSWEFTGITNIENNTIEIQGIGRDITEDKKIKEELEANEVNLDALINNTRDLIWSVDKEHILISANNAFKDSIQDTIGYYPQLGKNILSPGLSKELISKWKSYYSKALSGDEFSIIESSPIKNGVIKKIWISFNPIRDLNKEPIGVSCFGHDITDRVNFEDQMLSQIATLKEIASIASHDIRGPVASMLGLLSLVDRSAIKGEQNLEIFEYLEQAMKQLDSVIHIIVEKSAQVEP